MHAVIRETHYPPRKSIQESRSYRAFQREHEQQEGYEGTVILAAGEGRYLTVTLWENETSMNEAREAMEPVVERHLEPLMTAPSRLVATGEVLMSDLVDCS